MRSAPAAHHRASAVAAAGLLTMAGGAMDAWVYLAHGHVFANAQSGNVVLMGLALAQGDATAAAVHLPSLTAFVVGLLASQFAGQALKRTGSNSRSVRLGAECVMLLVLAMVADRLSNGVVTASVGFIAGVQITSLSHVGRWSFNTGMTTGNLRGAATAFVKAATGTSSEWPHALAMATMCVAFILGTIAGAWLALRLGGLTLVVVAALVALAAGVVAQEPDPLPSWDKLR